MTLPKMRSHYGKSPNPPAEDLGPLASPLDPREDGDTAVATDERTWRAPARWWTVTGVFLPAGVLVLTGGEDYWLALAIAALVYFAVGVLNVTRVSVDSEVLVASSTFGRRFSVRFEDADAFYIERSRVLSNTRLVLLDGSCLDLPAKFIEVGGRHRDVEARLGWLEHHLQVQGIRKVGEPPHVIP